MKPKQVTVKKYAPGDRELIARIQAAIEEGLSTFVGLPYSEQLLRRMDCVTNLIIAAHPQPHYNIEAHITRGAGGTIQVDLRYR